MRYPVDLLPCSCGTVIFVRDLPEVEAHGPTKEAALERCHDSLIACLDSFFSSRTSVPMPSRCDGAFICLPASIWAKVILLNAVVEQGITNTELARRMNLSRQEMNRIFNLTHSTKIDTIQKGLSVLGKQLEIIAN